ncbi:precorrin-2 dehydrogenase/sirohydrochlorin ferrochelatase family protein [Rubrobacter calidifluminis]|uniref:precorrin-2 dehydrogenase/sirohydrochlorin ferrochelatase family protein n=1 Tax=Rubrobacter calidifluminis TaxID=1392640 RepID=UPI00235E92A7|nr:bifunctional precorrin-2 dehydrogenase/sirohydrochlorin ferrochelatase [Rubrobacter calidifluminis]
MSEEPAKEDSFLYPVFFDLRGRRCVVIGGGGVATRKILELARAGAEVVAVAPCVGPEIVRVCSEVHERPYQSGDLDGAFLAFAATDSREVNRTVAEEAHRRGIPVNVADRPAEGDFSLPSVLRRGLLQVAVSTSGASPALARSIRRQLEGLFGREWEDLVRRVGEARRLGDHDEGLEEEVRACLSRLRG